MIKNNRYNFKSIAIVCSIAMLFFSCEDKYKRVGEEAQQKNYPQGVANNFVLTYTEVDTPVKDSKSEASKVKYVLTSETWENYENLKLPHYMFPDGLHVDIFDKDNKKSTVVADYGVVYTSVNLVDLQGNVVLKSHDGKKIETPQLYWDQNKDWMFTQEKFKFTNPEDGTVMNGEGMDFDKKFTVSAHKTYGIMTIKEEENE